MYFNTFGGNPVSAAVGTAVLDVIEEERLVENARDVGAYALEKLRKLGDRHALIGDVRGAGLFFAVELVGDRKTKTPATAETRRLVNLMRERGVLLSRIGMHDNILKIRPPMPSRSSMRTSWWTPSIRQWRPCDRGSTPRRRPSSTRCRRSRSAPARLDLEVATVAPIKVREMPCSARLAGGGRAVLRVHRAGTIRTTSLNRNRWMARFNPQASRWRA